MAIDANSFIAKYGVRSISYAVGIGLGVILLLVAVGSCATTVKNTDVGIVVNNITGTITPYENGGMVLHLPFGLSTVNHVDKATRNMFLTRAVKTEEHPDGEQVKIKTSDGSNVEADIELVYQIDVKRAFIAYRELVENSEVNADDNTTPSGGNRRGSQDPNNLEQILRAVTRAEVRNQLGALDTASIADPNERTKKLHEVQKKLTAYFENMAVEIVSVNAQNFHFKKEYEDIILKRKSADQVLVNQDEFRKAEKKKRERIVAEADKVKSNALAQLKGELAKRKLTAEGEAKRIVTKANQEAFQAETEGNIALANATQEAAAIKAEGEQKAEAMAKLFEAYEKGGEGLVREALVKFYEGVTVSAKPYSPSDRVDQIRAVPFQAEPNVKK